MEHSDNRKMWDRCFSEIDKDFFEYIETLKDYDIEITDFIHHFPIFSGYVTLARFLALYEAFKMVANISGHYADIGTWKGASFLFIAKLIKLFEPHYPSQIHSFDWFEGMDIKKGNSYKNYKGNYELLKDFIKLQKLSDVAVIHKIDLINELENFANDSIYSSIYFKYVFLDCGIEDVLYKTIPFFWKRLLVGGIMLFDHFGSDTKCETESVRKLLPNDAVIKIFPFARQPMGYAIKTRI